MYECDVWDFPSVASGRRFAGDWLARQEFYNQALSRHRLIYGGRLNGLEAIRKPDDIYRTHGESKEAQVWGEKSPVYAARLALLAKQYPNASFILIWRDPVAVYRSVLKAGKTTPFFRRPGMLHRLIFHQEKMIREANLLQKSGARVLHIRYDDLVDQTEATCRATCDFLNIPFTPAMLDLRNADLSAVYQEPQHEFLRRGIVERQKYSGDEVSPEAAAKLRRFAARWERLSGQRLGDLGLITEPSATERLFHRGIGSVFFVMENAKRLAFEFLPLPWLRSYRLFKDWLFETPSAAEKSSVGNQLAEHWPTIILAFLMLTGVTSVDFYSGPEVSLAAFYALPVMMLTVIVGRNWGSILALLASALWSTLQQNHKSLEDWNSVSETLLVWNTIMRFIVLQVIVFLLDRVRRELIARNSKT